MKATSFGWSSRSAHACLSEARTPESPHPAHHHEGVAVAKSLGVRTVATIAFPWVDVYRAAATTPGAVWGVRLPMTSSAAAMISIGRNGRPLYLRTGCSVGSGPVT